MSSLHSIAESTVEEAALQWLDDLGYEVVPGPELGPHPSLFDERSSYRQVALGQRLRRALVRVNPDLPGPVLDRVYREVLSSTAESLETNNRRFHRMLVEGVEVEYQDEQGETVYDRARLVDFNEPGNNDWLAANQFTVQDGEHTRRPDVVVFLNGLPVGIIELKNPGDEKATVRSAYRQLQTYKAQIPSLLRFNEILVASDGVAAKIGSLTAPWEWFLPWRTVDGEAVAPPSAPQLDVLIRGVFEKRRLLDLIQNFVTFGPDGSKKIALYHQYHAVNKAIEKTIDASSAQGDRRAGVVWHTQGSGKSITMAFYAGKIARDPAMANPTLVVLTDRNDLDDQLFGTFSAARELLRQKPRQADSREDLKDLLRVGSGGVVFTTIQKFFPDEKGADFPELSDRSNVIVIADEAHRSQYGFIEGFARHLHDALPNASFIGFTGTPIEVEDKSTRAVFGNYIDVYDIQQAVEDHATVPIYYEARLAKIDLADTERPKIDPDFEEATEGADAATKKRLERKWARTEALVGAEKRLRLVSRDLVKHFEDREEAIEGKGMIVCMSRRICVAMYDEITRLRPAWHDDNDLRGQIKIVMTGSASDPTGWQQHIRSKNARETIAKRFKDPYDPLKLVIVCDMWLTGFDVPPLHTLYLDKPMRGHTLMQAIARVNRVFRDKPGGLVVDYLGVGAELKKALANYTEKDRDQTAIPQETAVRIMTEKYEVLCAMLHGFNYAEYLKADASRKVALIPEAMEHILATDPKDGRDRFIKVSTELSKAFALAVPDDRALAIRDEVGFFQTLRSAFKKNTGNGGVDEEDMDTAVRQIVSRAVVPGGVVNIFESAGLTSPDISILSDDFLKDVSNMKEKNLAIEALRKLLNDEIKTRKSKNVVESRKFSKMLEESITKYRNRSLQAAEVIARLVELAKEMREAHHRGEELGLSEKELAFYDALATNGSAVEGLGDETLRKIAHELVELVRSNATLDWSVKKSVKAKMRTLVKRLLRKYKYPPDKQEEATRTVIEQAELFGAEWVA